MHSSMGSLRHTFSPGGGCEAVRPTPNPSIGREVTILAASILVYMMLLSSEIRGSTSYTKEIEDLWRVCLREADRGN